MLRSAQPGPPVFYFFWASFFLAVPFKIALVPLSAAICTFHLLSISPSCRGRSPFQACPRHSFGQRACRSAPVNQPLPWAQSPCLVRALSHMDLTFPWEAPAFAPIFAQRAIELQAVPSIQSLQPPSHEGILGPSAAELLDEAFPRTTAKRKLDLLEGLPLFQLIRKPAVASLRQSTLQHALVSRLLILLKAAGDSCPILALADEDPWMGWQLVSDVVSGRSESTLKACLGYLECYWCSDHRLPWVPLTVSATWKWMQALKDASPSAPTSGYQSLRWFAHMFQCAADADFFSSPLLKGSATLQAAPPLWQKPDFGQPSQAVGVAHRLGRARLGEHCWGHPRCPLLQVSLDGFAAGLQP